MRTTREKLASVGAAVPRLWFPQQQVNLQKFAVVACDQYSAQKEYWDAVQNFVGSAPVSYTHLDVYKRQIICRGFGMKRGI